MSSVRFLKFPVCGQHCGRISVKRYWVTASFVFKMVSSSEPVAKLGLIASRCVTVVNESALLLRKDDWMGGFAITIKAPTLW